METFETEIDAFKVRNPSRMWLIINPRNSCELVWICRVRIFYKYSSAYLEVRYKYGWPSKPDIEIKNILGDTPYSEIQKLWEAYGLFRGARLKGRGPSSGDLDNVSPAEMATALAYLYVEHQDRNDKEPTQYDLAAYYGKDRSTIHRYFKKHGISWEKMKSDAKDIAPGLPLERIRVSRRPERVSL